MSKKLTEWEGHESPWGDWVITTGLHDDAVCRGVRHRSKDLIVTAVNACIKLNPDHPELVAQKIGEMVRMLRLVNGLGLNDTRREMVRDILLAITKEG